MKRKGSKGARAAAKAAAETASKIDPARRDQSLSQEGKDDDGVTPDARFVMDGATAPQPGHMSDFTLTVLIILVSHPISALAYGVLRCDLVAMYVQF
jgi:hypothetical protein